MSVTTRHPARDDVPFAGPATVPATGSRRWALAGIGAGVLGFVTVFSSQAVNAVYDPDLEGDTAGIAEKLTHQTGAMFLFHSAAVLCALLLIVHAAGLFGRLRAVAPRSTAPVLALAGLVGTAVVVVLGSGLDTEFMMSLSADPDMIDPANAVMYNHWIGTIPWVWVLAGLAGPALFAVARTGGVPRWIGRVGLVLGGLAILLGVSPLEYMAAFPAALMLIVTGIGFTVGDRAFRGTR